MGLGHNETGAPRDLDTTGLGHNGIGHVELGHNETGAPRDWDTTILGHDGKGHNGTGTQRG